MDYTRTIINKVLSSDKYIKKFYFKTDLNTVLTIMLIAKRLENKEYEYLNSSQINKKQPLLRFLPYEIWNLIISNLMNDIKYYYQIHSMIDAWCSGIITLIKNDKKITTDYDGKYWYIYDNFSNKEHLKYKINAKDSSIFINKINSYINDKYIYNEYTDEDIIYINQSILNWEHDRYPLFV